ncbi:hypothetical protein AB3N04_00805 (plasmid) [Alkalihalophilus sp. As8PL]|uniref:Uncharacterized protein n=1 Tax=Alkalihalophilus sp. As8PL TaxID=3237103 RepID=A0AB39BNK3_9BACI
MNKVESLLQEAVDLRNDLHYAFNQAKGKTTDHKNVQVMNWLIEQAQRAEMYKAALVEIESKYEAPASTRAYDALLEADQCFYHSRLNNQISERGEVEDE